MADLSKEKGEEPFPQWAFIGFNLHRNTGKAHQSWSHSKDQTIDNIQGALRAYSESGSVSLKGYKTVGNKLSSCLDLIRKLRAFLAK